VEVVAVLLALLARAAAEAFARRSPQVAGALPARALAALVYQAWLALE